MPPSEAAATIDDLRQAIDDLRSAYYDIGPAEPVLELIEPGVAWIVEGRYGPTLISRNLPIWDIDGDRDVDLRDWDSWSLDYQDHRFRLYRTFAGLRLIATSGPLLHPNGEQMPSELSPWFNQIGREVGADAAYMKIAARQLTSRARLRPKRSSYRPGLKEPNRARACRFLGEFGHGYGSGDPRLLQQIELHDERTRALETDAPLF